MDRPEFEKLALDQLDAVYRMALQLARHPDEAADLAQETYLKALKAADRYEPQGGGIRPWLFKILHNVFYTRLAKKKPKAVARTAVSRKLLIKLSIMLRDKITAEEFDRRGRTVGNARCLQGSERTVV